ncbi:adhesion G-protein coupled receptor G6 isoform X2 [Trachinotus anak]|uniref:adhesion G-protein coupled receptor G6 isoform X2 n=1 Tax=Trachinotus anak TaxID=443729 RepID=UPI0039F1A4E5
MESSTGGGSGGGRRWRLRHIIPVVLLWMTLHRHVLGCSSTNCNLVLTEVQGAITSPCYPQKYPNSQACRWIMQAPAGFIIQLSFLDFDLEEAPGCIYDRVVVNTGNTEVKFCGLTANGLSLNSTGNVMELSFTSDFSVQKKGFKVSFRHVAVALRNQKVKITAGNGKVTEVANSVSIPVLTQLTLCFELERTSNKQKEWIFTYYNSNNKVSLSLGSSQAGMMIIIDEVSCPINNIISSSNFASTMKRLCVLWNSSNGQLGIYFNGNYSSKTCSTTIGHSVKNGGQFRLGGQQNLEGNIYNFRLWDYAMIEQELKDLTCSKVGNVIDWDNSYWTIPSSLAQTDDTLSCSVSPSSNRPPTASCDSLEQGCPAASSPTTSSTDSTNTIHATNANTHVLPTTTPSPSTIPTTSMPLTPTISTTTTSTTSSSSSVLPTTPSPSTTPTISMPLTPTISTTTSSTTSFSSSVMPTTTITITTSPATAASPATNASSVSSTTYAQQTTSSTATVSSATTNNPATNPTTHGTTALVLLVTTNQPTTNIAVTTASSGEKFFYRMSFVLNATGTAPAQSDLERAVDLWLNQTLQNWTPAVYMHSISLRIEDHQTSYPGLALLVYNYNANESLGEAALSARLHNKVGLMGTGLQITIKDVKLVENCPKEDLPHYTWPETRPTITQFLPCFPTKEDSVSRTCQISPQNYSSYWSPPNNSSCESISAMNVSAETAAEVAGKLVVITEAKLDIDMVSQVVTKVQELVKVAVINSSIAQNVVTIISNVMNSSVTPLATSSEKALRTVDKLVQKIEFDGPSINITSQNLVLGILANHGDMFNGTSFSAFIPPNSTNPQIDFESKTDNPLAQVTLPASLLSNLSLSGSDRSSLARINFMFFSSTNLFKKEQSGRSLNSYVVASSVGNISIRGLTDPVKIEIAHLSERPSLNPVCMFWDFNMTNGTGGWNGEGCRVSNESTSNKTVCLCDHLTHFGILMDISGAASSFDPKNNKILTFITYIGCGISAIFSAATLVTYIAFEKLRRDYPSKILMNLSASLLFLNMVFLLDGWLAMLKADWLCLSMAVLLHYFLLTSFTWMGLESIHMYIALVKVFNTYIRRYILKFCIVGWGLPAVLVGIVLAVDKNSYGLITYGKQGSEEQSEDFCWVKNLAVFYTTCVGYFCLVFLLNVAMFIVVMMQICGRNGKRSNRTLREEVLRNLRSAVSLTFLLGMTWGFALFAWGPVALAFIYLFTIFNSLQGLFIFIFHCALKENVQKQWRRYLCCGRFKLSDNSDWSKTATNNTKKVSSDNLGKSLSSSSFGSSTANWTSKAKATLNPFTKRHSNADKCYSNQTSPKCVSSSSSSSEVEPNSSSSSSSILPVSQMIDKVKDYCSTRSDNFYKNIIMSDSFAHSTRF